jgi:hypothetical protein
MSAIRLTGENHVDIYVRFGQTINRVISVVKEDGESFDFEGYTAVLEVYSSTTDKTPNLTFTEDDGILDLEGAISLVKPNTIWTPKMHRRPFVYFLWVTDPEGNKELWLNGRWIVEDSISAQQLVSNTLKISTSEEVLQLKVESGGGSGISEEQLEEINQAINAINQTLSELSSTYPRAFVEGSSGYTGFTGSEGGTVSLNTFINNPNTKGISFFMKEAIALFQAYTTTRPASNSNDGLIQIESKSDVNSQGVTLMISWRSGEGSGDSRTGLFQIRDNRPGSDQMGLQYQGDYSSTLTDLSLVHKKAVKDMLVDWTPTSGTVVSFDQQRNYGDTSAVAGNITVNLINASAKFTQWMRHNDSVEPTITLLSGGTAKKLSGNYVTGVDNYIEFILLRNSGQGTVGYRIYQ